MKRNGGVKRLHHAAKGYVELGVKQGLAQGLERGREEGKLEIAHRLMAKGMTPEEAAEITGLSVAILIGEV